MFEENSAIRPIKIENIPDMVAIWNQHHQFLTDNKRLHSIESLTEWFEGQDESNNRLFGYFHRENLR